MGTNLCYQTFLYRIWIIYKREVYIFNPPPENYMSTLLATIIDPKPDPEWWYNILKEDIIDPQYRNKIQIILACRYYKKTILAKNLSKNDRYETKNKLIEKWIDTFSDRFNSLWFWRKWYTIQEIEASLYKNIQQKDNLNYLSLHETQNHLEICWMSWFFSEGMDSFLQTKLCLLSS